MARSRARARRERSATIRTSTPGRRSIRRWGSGTRRRAEAARGARAADQDVGACRAARRRRRSPRRRRRTPPRASSRRAPRRAGAAPPASAPGPRRAAGPGVRTHSRSSSAPRRWAERQARRTSRWAPRRGLDQREQALADGLRRVGGEALLARADELGGQALGADLLGDLAQRDLAQRGEVLDPEEVVERRLDALGRVDLAGAQALEQRLGREVDQHDLVGARRGSRRGSSRARGCRSAR